MELSSDKSTQLRQLVEDDHALRAQLAEVPDEQEFMRILLDAANAKGIVVTESDFNAPLPSGNGEAGTLSIEALDGVSAGSRDNTFIMMINGIKKLFGW